jgi:hypothetical protein
VSRPPVRRGAWDSWADWHLNPVSPPHHERSFYLIRVNFCVPDFLFGVVRLISSRRARDPRGQIFRAPMEPLASCCSPLAGLCHKDVNARPHLRRCPLSKPRAFPQVSEMFSCEDGQTGCSPRPQRADLRGYTHQASLDPLASINCERIGTLPPVFRTLNA